MFLTSAQTCEICRKTFGELSKAAIAYRNNGGMTGDDGTLPTFFIKVEHS